MTPVFLDTVGLIAVWECADQWHTSAVGAFERLIAAGVPVVTTTDVLTECANAAARRPYRRDVVQLRRDLAAAGRLVSPSDTEIESAWVAYSRGEAGQAGIVDHLSFIVMKRLGISEAFTNDRHFVAAGFHVLF
jgi:predicted nucleic acid-binding protein